MIYVHEKSKNLHVASLETRIRWSMPLQLGSMGKDRPFIILSYHIKSLLYGRR